jgi:transposase
MRVTLPEEVRMRGDDRQQAAMWSPISPDQRVPPDHPLRPIRAMVDGVLRELSSRFEALYAKRGRPSIAPEKLLRALVLQLLYSVRSERLLMEQLDYNLLFRWFVGLNMDDPIWDATVFTKNRQRLLDGDIAPAFFEPVRAQARAQRLLGDEHFTVDGTLIEAWAGLKSFKKPGGPRTPPEDPGNPTVNFHGERRRNATHASTTDPEARLIRKGHQHETKLGYLGHALMDNRQGLVVQACVTPATGTAEWEAALAMVDRVPAGATLGADRVPLGVGAATKGPALVAPYLPKSISGQHERIDGEVVRKQRASASRSARTSPSVCERPDGNSSRISPTALAGDRRLTGDPRPTSPASPSSPCLVARATPPVRPSQVPDRNRRPADQAARPPMRLELRAKKLLGGGDDDPLAGTAEAESHGRGPRLACWHPIVPPSSAAVAAVFVAPPRAPDGPGRRSCAGA